MAAKTRLCKAISSVSVVVAAGAFFIASAHSNERFILAHAMPNNHVFHAISERFIEKVEDNDAFGISYHSGGDLGDWTSLFEQVMQGVVPMSITWGASEFDERLDLSWLGYVVSNWEDARQVYGPDGEMLEVYNAIFHDLDLHAIGIIPTDFGSLVIRKGFGEVPVNFPEDGNNIKVRVPPVPIAIERFRNLGFASVPIPLSEVYTSLQLGTVDARAFSTAVETYQQRDVIEANILTNDYFETAFWLVNKDWWEELDEEDREFLQSTADETVMWSWDQAQSLSEEHLEKVREAGINVVDLSDEQMAAAAKVVHETEWPEMEELVGPEIMNTLRKAAGIE